MIEGNYWTVTVHVELRRTCMLGTTSILCAIRLRSINGHEAHAERAVYAGHRKNSKVLLGEGWAGSGRSSTAESNGISEAQWRQNENSNVKRHPWSQVVVEYVLMKWMFLSSSLRFYRRLINFLRMRIVLVTPNVHENTWPTTDRSSMISRSRQVSWLYCIL